MKKIIALIFSIGPAVALAQFGVNFHQSNLPFVGFNYEFKEKIRPELRLGVDTELEDISIEGIVTYDVVNNEDFEVYAGLGVRANSYNGLVIPVGINFYPFEIKKVGFQIELAPIIGDTNILRGSWGIRYRFGKAD